MGSGASDQIRSRPEIATEVQHFEKLNSPGLSDHHDANNIIKTSASTKENMFVASQRSVVSTQSEIVTHLSHKSVKRQKSQKQRNSCGNAEAPFDNVPRHELVQKIQELELALAVSDSQRLDLQDQLQALEERVSITTDKNAATPTNSHSALNETLNVREHHIKKLEAELNNAQTNFQKKTSKLKKHIRGLTKQIFELRHEALITQMEHKTHLNDSPENQKPKATPSKETAEMSALEANSNIGHTKIIVELSSQISEQEEQIVNLKAEVAEKNQRIKLLKAALKETKKRTTAAHVNPVSQSSENYSKDIANTENIFSTVGEKHGSYGAHPSQKSHSQGAEVMSAYIRSHNSSLADSHLRFRFQHQATSLSDSDSDWDEGPCLSQRNRHSAPARNRVRSQIESDSTALHTSSISSKTDSKLHSGDNYLSNSLAVLNPVTSNSLFKAKEQL
ncbi:hypothetical protein BsWGS_01315 [Bradybaena similaris]